MNCILKAIMLPMILNCSQEIFFLFLPPPNEASKCCFHVEAQVMLSVFARLQALSVVCLFVLLESLLKMVAICC